MSHSPEHMRKKREARAESLHHFHNSAVDGAHHDMKTNEHMYKVHGRDEPYEGGPMEGGM
jgi:hypothetical protein